MHDVIDLALVAADTTAPESGERRAKSRID
jgi:hypothetical protein